MKKSILPLKALTRLEELDNNLGSSNFAQAKAVLGYGYFINHARNQLGINVSSVKALARSGSWKTQNGIWCQASNRSH